MTPSTFRDQAPADRIEMMAHRREVLLRNSHQQKVGETVAGLFKDKDGNRR